MKRLFCLLLCLLLALGGALALAEEEEVFVEEFEYGEDSEFAGEDEFDEAQDALNFEGAQRLRSNEVYELDLEGDGEPERVEIYLDEDAYLFEEPLELVVETDELVYNFPTYIYSNEEAFAIDLDGDGALEILLSGDEASADFTSFCLKFDREQGLVPIPFASANRGENTQDYEDFGYGRLDAIHGQTLTLSGSQDTLGTWWCARDFTLRDGRFELVEGPWRVVEDFTDPEVWEYRALILEQPLDATFEDGSSAVLMPGLKILITETDKVSYVGFITEDGDRGTFPITIDPEDNWSHQIYSLPESHYFSYLPYAD